MNIHDIQYTASDYLRGSLYSVRFRGCYELTSMLSLNVNGKFTYHYVDGHLSDFDITSCFSTHNSSPYVVSDEIRYFIELETQRYTKRNSIELLEFLLNNRLRKGNQ